jgi:hypothetical protein
VEPLRSIEAELDAVAASTLAWELEEQVREHVLADHATWTLADRLRSLSDDRVQFHLAGGHRVAGCVAEVGESHVELHARQGQLAVHAIVMLAGVELVEGLHVNVPPGAMPRVTSTIGRCLRSLQAEGLDVTALLRSGRTLRGSLLHVHRDHAALRLESGVVAVAFGALSGWLVTP